MSVIEMIKNRTMAAKVDKLIKANVNEYDAARQVITEDHKILLSKAEALKKKLNA